MVMRRKNYPVQVGLRVSKETHRALRQLRRRDEALQDTIRRVLDAGLSAESPLNTNVTSKPLEGQL